MIEKIVLVSIPPIIIVIGSLVIYFLNKRDKTIDGIKDSINRLFAESKSDIKELRAEMKSDNESLGKKFDSVNKRMDSHLEFHSKDNKDDDS